MNIFVIGGDGYIGWPLALKLSGQGHQVTIVDNFSRRTIDDKAGMKSLTPIKSLGDRIKTWRKASSRIMNYKRVDVANNYAGLMDIIRKLNPEVIVHLAKQRSVPYSMRTPFTRRYTITNNTSATNNILGAVANSGMDIHVINVGSLSTSGDSVYESIYSVMESANSSLAKFYSGSQRIKISDLRQGIVWGIETEETRMDSKLVNRYDYCGDYGTVVNRFVLQSSVGHPLTVYGDGEQARAVLSLGDACAGICGVIKNPPSDESVVVHDQFSEIIKIKLIANKVALLNNSKIEFLDDIRPKVASDSHGNVDNKRFYKMIGGKADVIQMSNLREIFDLARKHIGRAKKKGIEYHAQW